MPVSREYLQFVLDQLVPVGTIEHRRMFGGIGLYAQSLFFALIDDDTLFFKVNDRTRPGYREAGAVGFDPYGDGRASFNYMTVPVEVLEDRETLRAWAHDAIDVAREATRAKPARQGRERRE